MHNRYCKPLPGTPFHYYDARAAIDALCPGAYAALPYVARVYAENVLRRAVSDQWPAYLGQLIGRRCDTDIPWFPARIVCHDILGLTALVDLAGLRDAIAAQGGMPSRSTPRCRYN